MQTLDYFEIRACVDDGEETHSFLGHQSSNRYDDDVYTPEGAEAEAKAFAETVDGGATVFWTVYARWLDGTEQAVGDFTTFAAALSVMSGILAPMRLAANLIDDGEVSCAHDLLDDVCNQSSHEERL